MAEPSPDAIISVPCHLSGVTRLCFSPDGRTIFTGGSDCLVRIHEADNPESEPGFHDEHTEAVTCLACSKDELVTGCVDNIVRQFSYPENKFTGFVTRSSGVPIRWLSLDKAGERVAVCSDDMVIKIVNLKDTTKVSLVSDNNKPVRSATWDPTGKYLTTASCDGKLKVYDTSGSTPYCVKVFEGVIAASDSDSDTSCYAQWHPSGNFFAVPTRTNDIAIFGRDGWGRQSSYTPDGPKALIGELAWSPNGKYLAVAAATNLYIFSSETRQPIGSYTCHDGAISGLSFSPNANLLGFTSLDGSFHRWKEPIPSELPDPYTSEAARAKELEKLLDDNFPDDDEDIEERGEDIGDEDIFGDDNWIVDDDGNFGGYGGDDDEKKWGKGRTEVVNVTKAQAPFTPGSTSFRNKKRYLAFNMIGVVDVTDQETHNVVNVEFHDKSARRGYHFQDHNKYTLASLGEQGIVYACPAEGDQPSLVYYRPYDSWTSQSDWTLNLLPGENIVCLAAGGPANPETGMGSVVVATSKGWLRFLSASGIQKYMWRLGEEVVSMAAGVDRVLIAHREGGTSLDGCQNLRYTLLDLESYDIVQEGKIPLPKKTTLTWLGFTSDGAPAMFDTSGLLSILDRHRRPNQARWVPLLDTTSLVREGRKEGYWPVGVSATHLSYILLKGLETEPWFPRPLIQEVELHMPMLNMENQQGKLEESYVRGSVNLSNLADSSDPDASYVLKETELTMDKEMLQLVQGACKADNLQRALDVARLMHHSATIEAAAKVAAFYHLPGLQERIQGIKEEKEKEKREKKRSSEKSYRYSSPPPEKATSRQFTDFAPRTANRRSFAGAGVNRDSTSAASYPSSTFIPETPGLEVDATPAPGIEEDTALLDMKRKREKEIDDFAAPISKKIGSDFSFDKPANAAPKNPFASKKSNVPASNPFAKGSAGGRPLDATKSGGNAKLQDFRARTVKMTDPDTAAREAITIVSVLALLLIASIFIFVTGGRRKKNQSDVPDNGSSQTPLGSPGDNGINEEQRRRRKKPGKKKRDGKRKKKDNERWRDRNEGGTSSDGGSSDGGKDGGDYGGDHGRRRGSSTTSPDFSDFSSANTIGGGGLDNPPPEPPDIRAGTMENVFRIADDLTLTVQSNPDDRYRIRTIYQGDSDDSDLGGGSWPRRSDGPEGGAGAVRIPQSSEILPPFTLGSPATPLTPGSLPALNLLPITPGPFKQSQHSPSTPVTSVSAYPPVTASLEHANPILFSDVFEDGLDPWAYTSAVPTKATFTAEDLGWYNQPKEATKTMAPSDLFDVPVLDETLGSPELDTINKHAPRMFGHLDRNRNPTGNAGDGAAGTPRMENSRAWGELSPINLNPIYVRDPKDRDNYSTPILLSSFKTPNRVDKVGQKGVDQEQKVEANDKKHSEVITPHSAIKMPMTSKVRFGDVSPGPIISTGIEEVVRERLKKKNDSDRKVEIRNVKKKETASEQQQEVEEKKKCRTPKKALAIFEDDDIVKDEKPKEKLKEKEEIKKTAEKKEENAKKVKKLKEVEILVEDPETNEIVKKKSLKETEESEDEKVKTETSSKKDKVKNDSRTEDKVPKANTRKEKKKKGNKEQLSGNETGEEEEMEDEEGKKGDNDRKDKRQKNKLKKKTTTKEKNEEAAEGGKKKREKKRKEKVETDEDDEIDEEDEQEEREGGKKVKKAIKLKKKASVASADEDEKDVKSRRKGAKKKSMKRRDKAEDQVQNESSDQAVYEKYTDSDGEKRLRRVPIVTERRLKRKPKKNKQRMADASQYNRYNDDEEEMDEVQETAPAKQRKAPKQQQQSQITRQGRTLQDEQFLEDTAPINLTMSGRINQLQSPRHQHRYKELQSRIGNIEDDYDDPNLSTKERHDVANRRLRMLFNQGATEKETEELQRLMAEGSQRNVEDSADEVTRERKSLRETIRGNFAKTVEAKREDLQTDGSNTRLSTEDEEISLEDNVGTTAEPRQPTKPQRKRTLQSQDATVLGPTLTNPDDHKTYVSPSTFATEELWAGDSQEKPKEREIDPRLNLMASRRPGQMANPRQFVQAPRTLAPSARSMKELEANRLYLRQKRHPTEEETGAEFEAKKDEDATDGAELSLTLTREVEPHVASSPNPENPAEAAGLAAMRRNDQLQEIRPPAFEPEQESDEPQSMTDGRPISDTTKFEAVESRSGQLLTLSNMRWWPSGEVGQEEDALKDDDHLAQLTTAGRFIELQSPSANSDNQIITNSHAIVRRPAPLMVASNELQSRRTHFINKKASQSANELSDISDNRPPVDHYERMDQEMEIHRQTDYLPVNIHPDHEVKATDEGVSTKWGMTIEGRRKPMAIMDSASSGEKENGQAIGTELFPSNSASRERRPERRKQALDSVPIIPIIGSGTTNVASEAIISLTTRQQAPPIGNREAQMDSQPFSDNARQIPNVDRDRPVLDLTNLSEEQIAEYELTGNLPPTFQADYDLEEQSDDESATKAVLLGVKGGREGQAALNYMLQDVEEKMTESQIATLNRAPIQPIPERPELDSVSFHNRQTTEETSFQLVSSKGALPERRRGPQRPALSLGQYEPDREEEAGVDGNALVRSNDMLRGRGRPQLDSNPSEDRKRIQEARTDLIAAKGERRRPEGFDNPCSFDSVSYDDHQAQALVDLSLLPKTDKYDEVDVEPPVNEGGQRLLRETAYYSDESRHEGSGKTATEATKVNVKPLQSRQDVFESDGEVADTDIMREAIPRSRDKLTDSISHDEGNVTVPRQRMVPTRIVTSRPTDSDGESIPLLSGSTAINSSDEEELASQAALQRANIKNMEADQTVAIKNAVADNPELAREYQEAKLRQPKGIDIGINQRNGHARRRQNKGVDDSDTDAEDFDRVRSQNRPPMRRWALGYESDSTNDTASIHIDSDDDTNAPASQQISRRPPSQLSPLRRPPQAQEPSSPDPLKPRIETIPSENEDEGSMESRNRTPAEIVRDHWKNQSDRERQQRANEGEAQEPPSQDAGNNQQSDDERAPANSQSQAKTADSTGRQPRRRQSEGETSPKKEDDPVSPLSPDSKNIVDERRAKQQQREIVSDDDFSDVSHEHGVEGQQTGENPLEKPYRPEDDLPSPKTQPEGPQQMDQNRKEHRRFGHEDRRGRKENSDEEIIPKMSKKELRKQRLEEDMKSREAAEGRDNEIDEIKDRGEKSKVKERKQGDDLRSRDAGGKYGEVTGDDEKNGISKSLYYSGVALGPVALVKASWHILKTAPVWSFFTAATLAIYVEVSRQLFEMLSAAAWTTVLTKRATSNSIPVDLSVTQSWFSDLVKNLSFDPIVFFAFISMWSIVCIPIMGILIHNTLSVAAEPKRSSYWKQMWRNFKEYGRGSLQVLIMGRHFSTPRVFWCRSTRWTYLRILIFSIQLAGIVLIIRQAMSLIYMVGTGSSTSFSNLPDVAFSQKSMKAAAESLDTEGVFVILNFLFFLFLLTIAGSWHALLHPRTGSLSRKSPSKTADKKSDNGRQGQFYLPGVRTSLKWLFILAIIVAFTVSLLYFRNIASYIAQQSGDKVNSDVVILGVNFIFMTLMAAMGYVVYELDKIWIGRLKGKFGGKSGKGFRLLDCRRGKDESMV
ncbi:hypothetical protein D1P53_005400 [Cryptococcus gattii VGV]|nr:hypothetical protein D1P53_005400 [Cryptococcus gattii VGV]